MSKKPTPKSPPYTSREGTLRGGLKIGGYLSSPTKDTPYPQLRWVENKGILISNKNILDNSDIIIVLKVNNSFYSSGEWVEYLQQYFRDKKFPIILKYTTAFKDAETTLLHISSSAGYFANYGFLDGLMIEQDENKILSLQQINQLMFNILQGLRKRISKTEYIACPSCGRTLFDLQETTQKIKEKTSHLKGVKIGIMGCIVNGPGEMADADFGYVGTGPGKISLYKGHQVVKKNVPEDKAVEELIGLIKEYGMWIEPKERIENL